MMTGVTSTQTMTVMMRCDVLGGEMSGSTHPTQDVPVQRWVCSLLTANPVGWDSERGLA